MRGEVLGLVREALQSIRPLNPQDTDPVFTSIQGKPIDEHNFYERDWCSMLDRLGIRRRPFYNTRHTYLTELVAKGKPVTFIAKQAGTSVAMIERHYVCALAGQLVLDDGDLDPIVRPKPDKGGENPKHPQTQVSDNP